MDILFVYGSLGFGRTNSHIMENIGGEWEEAFVRGNLVKKGWGDKLGFPGIIPDENGEKVNGYLFKSENLKNHWKYLDEFEGSEYERVLIKTETNNKSIVDAFIYVLK